jgi:hypothetical protein
MSELPFGVSIPLVPLSTESRILPEAVCQGSLQANTCTERLSRTAAVQHGHLPKACPQLIQVNGGVAREVRESCHCAPFRRGARAMYESSVYTNHTPQAKSQLGRLKSEGRNLLRLLCLLGPDPRPPCFRLPRYSRSNSGGHRSEILCCPNFPFSDRPKNN